MTAFVVANNTRSQIKDYARILQAANYPVWICDGVDDNYEIQSALDWLNISGYGCVDLYLHHGDYNCSSPVQIPEGSFIHGAGIDDYGTMVHFNGCDGFTKKPDVGTTVLIVLQDLVVTGDNTHTVIDATGWGRTRLVRTRVRGGAIGVRYSGNYYNAILDSEIGNNLVGVSIDNGAHSTWICRSRIEGTPTGGNTGSTQIGLAVNNGAAVILQDTQIDQVGKGIKLGVAPCFKAIRPLFDAIASDGFAIDIGNGNVGVEIDSPYYDGNIPTITGTPGRAFVCKHAADSYNSNYDGKYRITTISQSVTLTYFQAGIINVYGGAAKVVITLPPIVQDTSYIIVDMDGSQDIEIVPSGENKISSTKAKVTHAAHEGDSFTVYAKNTGWLPIGSRGDWILS